MFQPGQLIKSFVSKKGNEVVLKAACNDDVAAMTDYMNEISREDTFITFSGEQLTLKEEQDYMEVVLKNQAAGDGLKLFAFIKDILVGNSEVSRGEKRSKHVGNIGLSIKKEYRGEGIGHEMMLNLIEAGEKMQLKLLKLSCYSINIAGLALYKKLGFIEVGRIPRNIAYKGTYIDEVILVREL